MPSAEAALIELLENAPAVAAIVDDRIYPDIVEQGAEYPCMRTQRISTARSEYRTIDGLARYARPRMQIDCYALSRGQAVGLAQAVYDALEGFAGQANGLRIDYISTEDEGSSLEPDVGPDGDAVYGQRLDIFMAHPEP